MHLRFYNLSYNNIKCKFCNKKNPKSSALPLGFANAAAQPPSGGISKYPSPVGRSARQIGAAPTNIICKTRPIQTAG